MIYLVCSPGRRTHSGGLGVFAIILAAVAFTSSVVTAQVPAAEQDIDVDQHFPVASESEADVEEGEDIEAPPEEPALQTDEPSKRADKPSTDSWIVGTNSTRRNDAKSKAATARDGSGVERKNSGRVLMAVAICLCIVGLAAWYWRMQPSGLAHGRILRRVRLAEKPFQLDPEANDQQLEKTVEDS